MSGEILESGDCAVAALASVRLGTDEEIAARDAEVARIEAENLRAAREELFLRSGITQKLEKVQLADLVKSGLAEMKDLKGEPVGIKVFDDFIADIRNGKPRCFIFYGDYGTGKSVFAAALARELCKDGVDCGYYKSHEIMQRLDDVKWHLSNETRVGIVKEVCRPKLRVIDEVGRYPDAKAEQFVLFDITNKCYEAFKSFIYITNLKRSEVAGFLGGAIIDRFKGFGMTIEFCGKSFRGTEKELYVK